MVAEIDQVATSRPGLESFQNMTLPRSFIQLRLESGARLGASQKLDQFS